MIMQLFERQDLKLILSIYKYSFRNLKVDLSNCFTSMSSNVIFIINPF